MKKSLISSYEICKNFLRDGYDNKILNYISLDIYEGDFTIIMGASGSGKSTLLYALSGMDKVTNGEILYKGADITHYSEKQMAALRSKEFGFVFQQTHLVSYLTLFENVAAAGYIHLYHQAKDVQERAEHLLKQMNVDTVMNHLPSQVSGGEAQRAAVARAMINRPGIIFADEPTGALNKSNTEQVLDLMTSVHKSGQSILMVTHDVRAAMRGSRLIYMEDGKIIGEKEMTPYHLDDYKKREAEIQNWLASMEW